MTTFKSAAADGGTTTQAVRAGGAAGAADPERRRASFSSMESSTAADWEAILTEQRLFVAGLADRVLQHLQLLAGDHGGFPIDRLQHSLQTADLAADGGEDDEYIVCALLHDIGDTLGSYNHASVAASVLAPFVTEENHWMVEHHAVFQGYHFFHHLGMDRTMRDAFRQSPHHERTAAFVERYDNHAFDSSRATPPLSAFEPLVRQTFSRPRRTLYTALLAES
jgi:predicted HD phosphohydrolase